MLGFIWNLGPTEIAVVAILSVLVFGRNLPQVAGEAFRHVARLRRYLDDLRRESGIDREIYDVKRTFTDVARDAAAQPTQSRPYPGHPGLEDRREEPSVEPEVEAEPVEAEDAEVGELEAPLDPRTETPRGDVPRDESGPREAPRSDSPRSDPPRSDAS